MAKLVRFPEDSVLIRDMEESGIEYGFDGGAGIVVVAEKSVVDELIELVERDYSVTPLETLEWKHKD